MEKKELVDVSILSVENKIITLRGIQVILDSDIADLYGIKTKRLNEQVQRNVTRFPYDFMFQLTEDEFAILRSQFATTSWNKRRSLPYAFTEQGVASLSGLLRSDTAIEANIQIMRAFVAMRRLRLAVREESFQKLLTFALVPDDG